MDGQARFRIDKDESLIALGWPLKFVLSLSLIASVKAVVIVVMIIISDESLSRMMFVWSHVAVAAAVLACCNIFSKQSSEGIARASNDFSC